MSLGFGTETGGGKMTNEPLKYDVKCPRCGKQFKTPDFAERGLKTCNTCCIEIKKARNKGNYLKTLQPIVVFKKNRMSFVV